MKRNAYLILLLVGFLSFFNIHTCLHAQMLTGKEPVQILRDKWGIPHIYSDDEWSLFYGAGYAAAQDRLFQMALARYSMQGRLSEFFGSRYLEHDKRLRTIGLYRHAQASLANISDTIRQYLEAYAAGVNAYMRDNPNHLSDVMRGFGGLPEPWSAADCIAAFLRIAEYFDRSWTNEVQSLRKFETLADSIGREAAIAQLEAQRRIVDDEVVIVSREEYERYPKTFTGSQGGFQKTGSEEPLSGDPWEPPKMSHNWVVHGSRSTTGLPILESDPQISVESPATWYEFHLSGGRFNVRGIGMPGAPGMLIGYSDHCAWGLTALGSDNADLFQEELKPGSQTEYKWMGSWETMQERTETIKVKNSQDVILTVKETRHGPVINDFVSGKKVGEVFALHWMVTQTPATSLEALIRMMSATDWKTFTKGMELYVSPGTHLIYADKWNNIAYYTIARLPLRVHNADIPFRGWTGDEEWKGVIPFKEMPRMLNPIAGFISTANNAPVGSWYPYYIGGGIGDNARSWRLRELLTEQSTYSPDDFFGIHRDMIDPIARDFARFGLMAVDEENPTDPDVLAAAALLRGWDYKLDSTSPTYPYTSIVGPTIKRSFRGTPLEDRYFGSDAGLAQLFRELGAYYDSTGMLSPDRDVRAWLIDQLGAVYRKSGIGGGTRPSPVTHKMQYQNNLEGFGSLASQYDMTSPPLHTGVVSTIWSQLGNSYSQIVNFAQLDSSYSLLPPGNSEVPSSKYFNDQIQLWVEGLMHPAPLSRRAITAFQDTIFTLNPVTNIERSTLASPSAISLQGNYPNPFVSSTVIRIEIQAPQYIELEVRNILGMRVAVLASGWKNAGIHEFHWDCRNESGERAPAGAYLYRIACGDGFVYGRMTLTD